MGIASEISRIGGAKEDIAAAIAGKGVSVPGGTKIDGMALLIAQIPSGIDTTDATATASDILAGKTAYADGALVTGNISSKGPQTYTPGTTDQTIAAGQYLSGAQTIAGDPDLISGNIKAGANLFGVAGAAAVVDTSGGDAVAANILSGKKAYVNGALVTGNIASKSVQTYTPGTTDQTIAAGQYLSGAQTITGDPDLVSGNIKAGANLFGVAGAAAVVDTSGGDAVAANILSGKKAYVNGALVTGNIASKGAATITPGTTDQTIAAGQYLSGAQTIAGDADLVAGNIKQGVNLFGVAGTFTSDANAVAGDMLSGKTGYVNGVKVTGNIASKGTANITPGLSNQTIAAGQYLSGVQTILGDADLVPENIRSGVTIFGITGNAPVWKSATGTANASGGQLVISGLDFTPRILVAQVNGGHILAYGDLLDDAGAALPFLQMLTVSPWYAGGATAVVAAGSITLTLKTSGNGAWSPANISYYVAGY